MTSTTPTEPLAEIARLSFLQAPSLCHPDHGCCVYHRAWSSIRLLLKGGILPAGGAFFADGLARVAQNGVCRVLLSGAADTGVAAMVLGALASRGLAAELVLAERCATSVAQNRLFAKQLGMTFEVHHGDILALECAPVDAVVAHSFINFLPETAQPTLVATWARVLRPEGVVLMHQKLGVPPGRPVDASVVEASRINLETAALAHGYDPSTAHEIGQAGVAFWSRSKPYHFPSAEDLVGMFMQAGLECLQLERLKKMSTGSPSHLSGVSPEVVQSLIMARRPK